MVSESTTLTETPAKLLDVQAVADLCGCSARTCTRLSDAGKMPAPVRLGALVRWPANVIEDWIKAGCPSCDEGSL
jgi:predicted DNA-binding transcriptional regulator AlpA